eukprot:scaffold7813_cov17-Prasinocladus_malaysianus.AAC.1
MQMVSRVAFSMLLALLGTDLAAPLVASTYKEYEDQAVALGRTSHARTIRETVEKQRADSSLFDLP